MTSQVICKYICRTVEQYLEQEAAEDFVAENARLAGRHETLLQRFGCASYKNTREKHDHCFKYFSLETNNAEYK